MKMLILILMLLFTACATPETQAPNSSMSPPKRVITNNTDGRGNPSNTDDRLLLLSNME
jgi:hypothetical protein